MAEKLIKVYADSVCLVPRKMHLDDAGFDMYTVGEYVIQPGEVCDVHTGVRVIIPPGMFGRITGRSSTMRKYGLLVNEGIVDAGYTGELFICVKNVGVGPCCIMDGVRLAQLLIHEVPAVYMDYSGPFTDEVRSTIKSGRRDKGFGSSGRF